MDEQQFTVVVDLLNRILMQLEDLNERFAKYDAEEQINDEMMREAQNG